MNDLEVELCNLAFNRSRFFPLNTPVYSVLKDCTDQLVLFSIDLKHTGNLLRSFINNFYDRVVLQKLLNPWSARRTQ